MKVAVPVLPDGRIDPRWGRADRVAVAELHDGAITAWSEHEVGWSVLHGSGTDGAHHARIAHFLRDNGIEAVVVGHTGEGMARMLHTMKIRVETGQAGDAREAVATLV